MEIITRSKLREYIMTILYQINIYEKNNISYDVKDVIKKTYEIENEFITTIVFGVLENKKDLDKLANRYLDKWSIDRLGNTDQAILRMALYELLHTNTPKIVVIDEALNLANNYSDDNVKGMINSVLDKVYHEGNFNE